VFEWGITFRNGHASRHRLYYELAELYDRFYSRVFDYNEFYRILEPELTKRNVSTIMEVACGTGRLMKILEDEGYAVTGLDLSEEMLKIAKKRVHGRLLNQDMRSIEIDARFDAVVCMGSSFTYMQSEEDVMNALRSFHRQLREDGLLIFDNFNADRFDATRLNKWREETYEIDGVKVKRRTRSRDWDPETQMWWVDWDWTITEDGAIDRYQDVSRLKAFTVEYLEDRLYEAGFKSVRVLEAPRLTMLAERG
jgi:SAM-dependent methyltransferase